MKNNFLFEKSIPLYIQIKELLINKINNKEWIPGDIIPSEITLAEDLNVSLGTVRKAIAELVDNNILNRKQGKGTFVKTHDMHRALFHFFSIVNNNGEKIIPHSKVTSITKKTPNLQEMNKLQLSSNEKLIDIRRTRELENRTIIIENIMLPYKIFGQLLNRKKSELPNTLYEFYESHFKVTIHSAKEKISVSRASKKEAEILDVSEFHPLLNIERLALTLNKTPVELRISKCNTANHYYDNTVL